MCSSAIKLNEKKLGRYLITTSIEETWPISNIPVLFLGEWCRLYSRQVKWQKLDALVSPYHWNDRQKLHKDYVYLKSIYEEILIELAAKLNSIHGVEHSVQYWRIVVGPWLAHFIQMLFDRWFMLQQAICANEISGARVLFSNGEQLVPNDMAAFNTLFVRDAWNEMIYGQILDLMDFPVQKVYSPNKDCFGFENELKINQPKPIKNTFLHFANYLSRKLYRDDEYFFISSYIPIIQELILQAKLGQLPKRWIKVEVPKGVFDNFTRQWELGILNKSASFDNVLRTLIPRHIPIDYLETYKNIVTLTESLPWPKRPKAIFTSNSFSSDDVFKVWAAENVERGVPLVIGQHGGNYGSALWNFEEDHQIAISTRFLTWGWTKPEQDNVSSVGNFTALGEKIASNKIGKVLLVEMTIPQYSYHMFSAPVAAGQWQSYFEDQCRFVQALPRAIQDQVVVRLDSQDWGHNQKQRWQDRFPYVELDNGLKKMSLLMSKSRIYVSTYNATTYLESLSINFPTLMFWNIKHWELRISALPYFDKLKSVGIFHETPESAAKQLAAVWDDVAVWWQSSSVQNARLEFCERYTGTSNRPVDILQDHFERHYGDPNGKKFPI